MSARLRGWKSGALLAVLALLALPFVVHAVDRGLAGFAGDAEATGWLRLGPLPARIGIFTHMLSGAVITALAFVQLLGPRWPRLHRFCGRALVGLAIVTASGGLIYIAISGTEGGPLMSFWFSIYGLLMLIAALQTIRFARARDFVRHRRWGMRLAVLALASWFFRLHYTVWVLSFGRWGMLDGFEGWFDRVQMWAFFVPYLVALQMWFWWERRSGSGQDVR